MVSWKNLYVLVQEGRFYFEKQPVYWWGKGITIRPYIWQKQNPGTPYLLLAEIYREPDFKTSFLHYMVDTASNKRTQIEDVTWVDWDQQGRLVFARNGQLCASESSQSPLEVQMIADFRTNTPKPVLPLDWAKY